MRKQTENVVYAEETEPRIYSRLASPSHSNATQKWVCAVVIICSVSKKVILEYTVCNT